MCIFLHAPEPVRASALTSDKSGARLMLTAIVGSIDLCE